MSTSEGESIPVRPSERKALLRRFVALVASVLIALAAGEALCRWAVPPRPPIRFRQDVDELNQYGLSRFADILQPDAELFWRLPPGTSLPESAGINFGVIANAARLREDHEIPVERSAGEFRVLFLGDSCTFGAGVHVRDCYVEQTERLLKGRLDGTPVECINAGVPGYTLYQGWRYWESEGHRYKPDLVVLCFGFNDLSHWDGLSDWEHAESVKRSQPPALLRSIRMCQLAWELTSSAEPRAQRHPRLSPDEFKTLLTRMEESTRSQGAGLMLVSWPIRIQVAPDSPLGLSPHQQVMQRFHAKHSDVDLVDLVPVFQELCRTRAESDLYLDNVHTTALANSIVAEHVADAVASWRRTAGK